MFTDNRDETNGRQTHKQGIMQHFLHLGLAFNTPERKRASVPQSSTGTEFVDFWESKGVRVRKSLPLSAQSNGAIERQYQGVIKAMAAAKAERKHWKTAMDEYIHTRGSTILVWASHHLSC